MSTFLGGIPTPGLKFWSRVLFPDINVLDGMDVYPGEYAVFDEVADVDAGVRYCCDCGCNEKEVCGCRLDPAICSRAMTGLTSFVRVGWSMIARDCAKFA